MKTALKSSAFRGSFDHRIVQHPFCEITPRSDRIRLLTLQMPRWLEWSILSAFVLTSMTVFSADRAVEDLYAAKCVWCHGNNGRGSRVGRELGTKLFKDPEMEKLSVDDFAKIIKEGKNNMPSFKKRLSDEQTRALAKYVRELK